MREELRLARDKLAFDKARALGRIDLDDMISIDGIDGIRENGADD
jgi:hypothetical protein